jgi:CRP-like cAMP-binding protein
VRLEGLAARSVVRTVDAGRIVALRGRPATHLIVVERGALTASHSTPGGRRLRLGRFAAPCAVNKAAVLDGGGHTATWTTATRTRLRFVPAHDLLAIVDDVPAARRHVLAHLARTVRDQQDDLARAHVADVTTRTAAWLLRAADHHRHVARRAGRTGRGDRCDPGIGQPGAAPEVLAHRADHDRAT